MLEDFQLQFHFKFLPTFQKSKQFINSLILQIGAFKILWKGRILPFFLILQI